LLGRERERGGRGGRGEKGGTREQGEGIRCFLQTHVEHVELVVELAFPEPRGEVGYPREYS
jgi:hypothetical protein